jgi:transcriptional regulator with XRE-family HTH domain
MEQNEVVDLIEQLMARGWTETEIAARLGVSQVTVNRWRREERHPPLERLIVAELRRMLRVKGLASVRG